MKAKLVPIRLKAVDQAEFDEMLGFQKEHLKDDAEFLDPIFLGDKVPQADAAIFPVVVGEAYKELEAVKKIGLPILIITSEFGTMNMWDWEIYTYFKSAGLEVYAPYSAELARVICRSLALKREMHGSKFVVYQDNPGEGEQPEIFKRFYWWEPECSQKMKDKFGIDIVVRSYEKLAADAKAVSDDEARKVAKEWKFDIKPGVTERNLLSAFKMYIVLKREALADPSIVGMGANCLNESRFSDTTPCLAWSMLHQEMGLMWSCEADTISMLTQYLIDKTIKAPIFTTNVYPFLMGMAALKHEKINEFPDVPQPENHLLLVHCGYCGFIPQEFASKFEVKPKVLAIVNDNSVMVDAEIQKGNITLTKIHPDFNKILVEPAELEGYVGYPGSDCRNGGLVRVRNGYELVDKMFSHHTSIAVGDIVPKLQMVARVFGLEVQGCN